MRPMHGVWAEACRPARHCYAMTRVTYALRFLRLTEATGRPTDRLRASAGASDEEWRDLLAAETRS